MATLGVSFADVSITGTVNQAISVVSDGGSTTTTLGNRAYASGDSLITFAGSEDLGDGMKASFKFEPRLNIGGSDATAVIKQNEKTKEVSVDGTNGIFGTNREAWIGLSGAFGTVHVGNNYTPMFNQSGSGYDPNGFTNMPAYFGSYLMSFTAKNSIDYTAPKFIEGLGIQLNKGFANKEGSTDGDSFGWGFSYTNSGFTAGIGGEKTNKTAIYKDLTTIPSDKDMDKLSLGAAYDFGSAKISVHRLEAKTNAETYTSMGYGVSVPLGVITLNGSYSTLEKKGGSEKPEAFQVGGSYAFSKRTSLYLLTGQIKVADSTSNMTSLGVVHSF